MKKEKFKSYSKIIYVLALISRIFILIGAVCMLILIPLIPIFVNNIDISKNEINFFGEKIEYNISGSTNFSLTFNNEEVFNESTDNEQIIQSIVNSLTENSKTKIIVILELNVIFGIISTLVIAYALYLVYKLFKNFYESDTPFEDENALYVRKFSYCGLLNILCGIISGLIMTIGFNTDFTVKINLVTVIALLAIYSISYIFEYGKKLENKKAN